MTGKISEMTDGGPLAAGDDQEVVRAGANVRVRTLAKITSSPNNIVNVAVLSAGDGSMYDIDLALTPAGGGALLASIPDGGYTGGNKRGFGAVDLQTNRGDATNVAAGDYSVVVGGYGNAAGIEAVASGGEANNASAPFSAIAGGMQATTRAVAGSTAYANGNFAAIGDAQRGHYIFGAATSDATPTEVTSNISYVTSGAMRRLTLPDYSSYKFRGDVIAANKANGDSSGWEFSGVIKRGLGVGATGVLTLTATADDTKTVTITGPNGARVYTFQAALTDVPGNVLAGATQAESVANLVAAINKTDGGAAQAWGQLNFMWSPVDGDTVVINGRTYTFESTLTDVDGHVWIGSGSSDSNHNLIYAINCVGGVPGVNYAASTTPNADVIAEWVYGPSSLTVTATGAWPGPAGNAITTTTTIPSATWAQGATMINGTFGTYAPSTDINADVSAVDNTGGVATITAKDKGEIGNTITTATDVTGASWAAGVLSGGASATALVAAVTPSMIAQDSGMAATAIAVTADVVYGGLAVTVTGLAATDIQWVCDVQTVETTYAP